jgi:hypothetical protein
MWMLTECNALNTKTSLICCYETIIECLIIANGRLHQINKDNFERKSLHKSTYKPHLKIRQVDSTGTYPSNNPRILDFLEVENARKARHKSNR